MALNGQYEEIGKGFVQQYYALFDDPNMRPNLVHLFNVSITFFQCVCLFSMLGNLSGQQKIQP